MRPAPFGAKTRQRNPAISGKARRRLAAFVGQVIGGAICCSGCNGLPRRGWELHVIEGGRHTKVKLNGRQTVVPRHAVELPQGTLRAILRQLEIAAGDLEV